MTIKSVLYYITITLHLLLWGLLLAQGGTGIDGNFVFFIILALGGYLLVVAGAIQGFVLERGKQFLICSAIALVPFFL